MTDTLVERMTADEIADRVLILSASFNAGKVGRQTCDLAYAKLKAQTSRIAELEGAARALIDDVRRRYPGEELRCPLMIALDKALS